MRRSSKRGWPVEAIKGVRTLSELSAAHGVHPTVMAHWKRQLLDGAPEVFRRGLAGTGRSEEVVTAPLYQEIGRLKMELEWLKKSCEHAAGCTQRARPCALVALTRSMHYYEPVSERDESLALIWTSSLIEYGNAVLC